MLTPLAIHSARMAVAASPAPRKIPFNIHSNRIGRFAVSIRRVNPAPVSAILLSLAMSNRMSSAKRYPGTAISSDKSTAITITCAPVTAAARRLPSPTRRDTIAVAAALRPIAIE